MLFYILIASSAILGAGFLYSLNKNYRLKLELKFLTAVADEDKAARVKLEEEKLVSLKQVEQLSSKLQHQEQIVESFEKLREESNKSTKAALFDLGNELSKQLIDIHKKENKETREISEKNIENTAKKFNSEFERVVNMVGSLNREVSQSKEIVDVIKNSLLSPSGAGNLAEITLENILKQSNLRINIDFIMQYSAIGENQEMLRPDAVIFLPHNNLMVIDAKASKFLVDDQDDMKNLAKTMNTHLRSLSGKPYAEAVRKNLQEHKTNNVGNIMTLMFLPSEQAVEKLVEADKDFLNKAWKANIFPVGPSGIMNMLSFARFQVSEQMMMHNHQQIIEEVKKLLGSVSIIADHSTKLGNSLSSAVGHYDKFAGSFNRNLLSKARNISQMGIESPLKKDHPPLKRFQVIAAKSELIEVEPEEETTKEEVKKLEGA